MVSKCIMEQKRKRVSHTKSYQAQGLHSPYITLSREIELKYKIEISYIEKVKLDSKDTPLYLESK